MKANNIIEVDMSPLFLKVDHVAADIPPTHAVKHMCRLADKMGIMIECKINKMRVSVFPGTNEDLMAERYIKAKEKGADWIASNTSPVTIGF